MHLRMEFAALGYIYVGFGVGAWPLGRQWVSLTDDCGRSTLQRRVRPVAAIVKSGHVATSESGVRTDYAGEQ